MSGSPITIGLPIDGVEGLASKSNDSGVKTADFVFDNTPLRVIALRSCPKIEIAGLTLGPFEEGDEYEIRFWIGQELEKASIVRFGEETLGASRLYKIQWTERIQSASQLSSLPESFYPRIRRLLEDLKAASKNSPDKMREYEYTQMLSQDIVNCRLKKIISLASATSQESQALRNLTPEEQEVYGLLRAVIGNWRSEILEKGNSEL